MLLAASPGGPTSNLFSYVYKGDVALNITLTATNSVMATFTLPFIVNLSFLYFMTDQQQIGMPIEKMAQVFLLIIVPVCVGMAVRNAIPQIALQLGKPMRLMSIYFIFVLFFYALFRERANVFDYFSAIGIATALFCFLSLLIGYLVPYLAGVPDQQARSCCFEIGIHNTAVALTIALSVLQSTEIAIPSAIYTIFMYMFSFILGSMLARQSAKLALRHKQEQSFNHNKNTI
nr:bile acid:sodium symporter [Acinetobacter sp. PW68]